MPTRLDRFHVFANGNIVSTKYASAFESEGIRLAQNARIYGTTSGSGVSLSKQLALNTRNGVVVAEARQLITSRAAAVAVRGVLGGPVLGSLLVGGAVLQWFNDSGLVVEDGQPLIAVQPGPTAYDPVTATSPAGVLSLGTCPGSNYMSWVTPGFCRRGLTTCSASDGGSAGVSGSCYPLIAYVTASQRDALQAKGWFYVNNAGGGYYHLLGAVSASGATVAPPRPATPQEVEDALASSPLSPAALKQLGDAGITPNPASSEPPSITNPQPSPEKTTTKTNPDGSTETTVCQITGTVVNGGVRLNESCTTTLRDPLGNITGTSTTTTDQADPEPGQEEQSLFCELFPNVLACAEFGDPTGDDIPTETRNVDFDPEVLFGAGTCPADTSISVNGQAVAIGQWSTWCGYAVDYVRPIVLLLAAFAALMIVARGMPE